MTARRDGIIHLSMPDEPLFESDEFCSHYATIEYARWLTRDGHPVGPQCGAWTIREGGKVRAIEFVTPKELIRRVELPSWMAA